MENRIFFRHAKTDKLSFGNEYIRIIGNKKSPKLIAGGDYFFGIWVGIE
jgi:hypothetical protein